VLLTFLVHRTLWHSLEDETDVSAAGFLVLLNVLLFRRCCVSCSSLLLSPSPLSIVSYIVSDVIVHYENHPLTNSGIHVIVKAHFWALWGIIRRLRLPLRAGGEPHPPLTSVLANPLTVPGPICGARAPDRVPSSLPPFLNSTIDKHCLLVYGVSIFAFPRVASNFLPTQITEFRRD
jgi:hypothetical protein